MSKQISEKQAKNNNDSKMEETGNLDFFFPYKGGYINADIYEEIGDLILGTSLEDYKNFLSRKYVDESDEYDVVIDYDNFSKFLQNKGKGEVINDLTADNKFQGKLIKPILKSLSHGDNLGKQMSGYSRARRPEMIGILVELIFADINNQNLPDIRTFIKEFSAKKSAKKIKKGGRKSGRKSKRKSEKKISKKLKEKVKTIKEPASLIEPTKEELKAINILAKRFNIKETNNVILSFMIALKAQEEIANLEKKLQESNESVQYFEETNAGLVAEIDDLKEQLEVVPEGDKDIGEDEEKKEEKEIKTTEEDEDEDEDDEELPED